MINHFVMQVAFCLCSLWLKTIANYKFDKLFGSLIDYQLNRTQIIEFEYVYFSGR